MPFYTAFVLFPKVDKVETDLCIEIDLCKFIDFSFLSLYGYILFESVKEFTQQQGHSTIAHLWFD